MNKGLSISIIIGIIVVAIILLGTRKGAQTSQEPDVVFPEAVIETQEAPKVLEETTTQKKSALKTFKINNMIIDVQKEGQGVAIENGKTAVVNYTGKLTDGTVFDSSIPRGQPFEFLLGAGRVIEGWDKGVLGMKVGEVRTLTIPPEMGYGARGAGALIPPNATLVFEVELLAIK
jgi:FKBP-type peptidyl-prolyl cis-trans isomerase